jgi:glycosyltransferase involved in cell wall biosynthesis
MIELCKKSEILYDFPIMLIHNGVDTNVFKPHDKQVARKDLGLAIDAKIFLFSAYGIGDRNKGLDRLICAIEKVDALNKVLVCIGGINDGNVPKASFRVVMTGLRTDKVLLSKYYSASDFFTQCSYEESFGQTVLESMSCGTPVISTPVGVSPELIKPFNGVVCNGYDVDAIAEGIQKAVNAQYDSDMIRKYIVENYEYSIISQQYKELYESILKS